MIDIRTPAQIEQELKNFSGTTGYYPSSFKTLKLTDGVHYLRESTNSYWLIDIVESIQHLKAIQTNTAFIIHKLQVSPDHSFIFTSYSDYSETDTAFNKEHLLYTLKGELTDFPLKQVSFYQNGDVLLLPGEY